MKDYLKQPPIRAYVDLGSLFAREVELPGLCCDPHYTGEGKKRRRAAEQVTITDPCIMKQVVQAAGCESVMISDFNYLWIILRVQEDGVIQDMVLHFMHITDSAGNYSINLDYQVKTPNGNVQMLANAISIIELLNQHLGVRKGTKPIAVFADQQIEQLWENLEDQTMTEEGDGSFSLVSDWFLFPAGTPQMEIWVWFNCNHSKGVHWLATHLEI